jgi:hypothetical protein
MEMQIHLHDQTMIRLKKVSQEIGVQEENLVQRAVLYYLDTIQKHLELHEEIKAWDILSDEALVNFEAML